MEISLVFEIVNRLIRLTQVMDQNQFKCLDYDVNTLLLL